MRRRALSRLSLGSKSTIGWSQPRAVALTPFLLIWTPDSANHSRRLSTHRCSFFVPVCSSVMPWPSRRLTCILRAARFRCASTAWRCGPLASSELSIIWYLSNCTASEKRIMSSPPYFQDKYNRSAGKPRIFFVVVVRKLLNTLSTRLYCDRVRLESFPVYRSFAIVELATTSSLVVSDALVCATVWQCSLAVPSSCAIAVLPELSASYGTPRYFVVLSAERSVAALIG